MQTKGEDYFGNETEFASIEDEMADFCKKAGALMSRYLSEKGYSAVFLIHGYDPLTDLSSWQAQIVGDRISIKGMMHEFIEGNYHRR